MRHDLRGPVPQTRLLAFAFLALAGGSGCSPVRGFEVILYELGGGFAAANPAETRMITADLDLTGSDAEFVIGETADVFHYSGAHLLNYAECYDPNFEGDPTRLASTWIATEGSVAVTFGAEELETVSMRGLVFLLDDGTEQSFEDVVLDATGAKRLDGEQGLCTDEFVL